MKILVGISLIVSVMLAGCATAPLTGTSYKVGEARSIAQVEQAVVVHKRFVQLNSESSTQQGTGLGTILGGVVGSAFGGGSGRLIATAVGAIGGGIAGSHAGQKAGRRQGVQLTVKTEYGREKVVVQQVDPKAHFAVGQHVQVITTNKGITRVTL